jgi:two-component system sensor kinase FixL
LIDWAPFVRAWPWAAAYLATGLFVVFTAPASGAAIWYPSVAIGMAMIARNGYRCAIWVFLAELVITFIQYDHDPAATLIVAANSTLEASVGAFFTRPALEGFRRGSISRYPMLLMLAGGCATLLCATLGTLLLLILRPYDAATLHEMWLRWWLGDATGVICILPLLLMWDAPAVPVRHEGLKRHFELLAMAVLLTTMLTTAVLPFRHAPLTVGGAPWIVTSIAVSWAAIRFSPRVTAIVIAVIETTLVLSYWSVQPMYPAGMFAPLANYQILMSLVSINGVALSLALHYERRARVETQIASKRFSENERRLQGILDNMIEGCQIIDRDFRYQYLNPAALRHGRRRSEELIGRKMQDVFPGIETLPVFHRIQECMESKKATLFENEFAFEDGTSGVFQLSIQPVPEGVMVLSHDVTQARRAQGDSAKTTILLRAVVEASSDFIAVKDRDGRYLLVNPSAARLVGMEAPDLVGCRDEAFLDPESARRVREFEAAVMAQRATLIREYDLTVRDGRRVSLLTMKAPFLDESGQAVGVITVARDTTETRNAARAIAASEVKYRTVFDNADDALFVIGDDGVVTDVNHRARKLMDLSGTNLHRSTLEKQGLPRIDEFESQIDGHPAPQGRICDVIQPGGSIVPVEFRRRTFESDGIRRELIIARDLTVQRRAETLELQHHSQIAHLSRVASVGEIASSLAHELNQPLMAILSFAGLLQKHFSTRFDGEVHAVTDVEKRGFLNDIEQQALRAAEIIRGIRRFIHKEPMTLSDGTINDAVLNALDILRFQVRDAGVELTLDLAPDLPSVLMDSIQIEQVMINLAHNAIEAMELVPANRRVLRIGTALASQTRVEVTVADTGPGMSHEVQKRLFESFFTTKPNGLGLGLSICRSIVEAHEGTLVPKLNTSQGMVFSFTLPTSHHRPA